MGSGWLAVAFEEGDWNDLSSVAGRVSVDAVDEACGVGFVMEDRCFRESAPSASPGGSVVEVVAAVGVADDERGVGGLGRCVLHVVVCFLGWDHRDVRWWRRSGSNRLCQRRRIYSPLRCR